MIDTSNVQAPVKALPGEINSQKRHWLQTLYPPVERVTAPRVQEAASPEPIVVDFIRQHSASGRLVAYSIFLQPPYSVPEADFSVLLDTLCQDAISADITRVQGTKDAYLYSTQAMTIDYANTCTQMIENDICRAIAETVRFDGRTHPHPCKVTILTQPPYGFESQRAITALTAVETHPDYADIRTMKSSNAEPCLFSKCSMSYGKAYGLCEWLEVEQYQNP